jgi:hypothetical protein
VSWASVQDVSWRTSSRSVGDGACVEVAFTDTSVLVRDSKDQVGPILMLDINSWNSLISSLKTEGVRADALD